VQRTAYFPILQALTQWAAARGVFNTRDCKLFLAAPTLPDKIASVEIYLGEAAVEMSKFAFYQS
jgi:hypothetical protein